MIDGGEAAMDFSTWDGAAALQQLSAPAINAPPGGQQFDLAVAPADLLDPAMFTTEYNEDPMFLMGLTGFDMMGFGYQE